MEIKQPLIFSVTQKESILDTSIYKSLQDLGITYYSITADNTKALSTMYNAGLNFARSYEYDCVIFVHDDVTLLEDPIPRLEKLFDDYDIVGVAGTSKIELKPPALWHLMGGGFDGGNLHGQVNHNHNGQILPTYFGKYPHRVVMIDGVFMALNLKAITESSFDEENPSNFHFYDINFSCDSHKKGLKLGVGDIPIVHESQGLKSFTDDWLAGEKYFLNKYNK